MKMRNQLYGVDVQILRTFPKTKGQLTNAFYMAVKEKQEWHDYGIECKNRLQQLLKKEALKKKIE